MGKKPKPFITELQAEGQRADRRLIREEIRKEASELVNKMPTFGPDRLIYVRNLYAQALHDKIDKEVFKEFIRITNSYQELQSIEARTRLIAKERRHT